MPKAAQLFAGRSYIVPCFRALPKKRCLELSGARDSSIYWVGRVPDTFFWPGGLFRMHGPVRDQLALLDADGHIGGVVADPLDRNRVGNPNRGKRSLTLPGHTATDPGKLVRIGIFARQDNLPLPLGVFERARQAV